MQKKIYIKKITVGSSLYAPTVLLVVIDYRIARRREVNLASMTWKAFLFDIQKK
jgi:hypothetical protein